MILIRTDHQDVWAFSPEDCESKLRLGKIRAG